MPRLVAARRPRTHSAIASAAPGEHGARSRRSLPQPGARGGQRTGPRAAALSRALHRLLAVQAPGQKEPGGAADVAERERHEKRTQVARRSRESGTWAPREAEGAGKTSERAGGGRMSRRGLRSGGEGRKGGRRSGARNPAPGPAFLRRRRRRRWSRASRPFPVLPGAAEMKATVAGVGGGGGGPEGRAAALSSRSPAPCPACGLPVRTLGGIDPPLPLRSSFNRTAYLMLAGFPPGDAV